MKLTYAQLKAKNPCEDQLEIYMANFPDNLEIKEADLLKAAKFYLDLDWFAFRFLSAPAREAYRKATAPAREAYHKAIAPAEEAYQKAIAPAEEAYQKAIAPAEEAYGKAVAPVLWSVINK